MKPKRIILFVFTFLAQTIFAQTYYPFPTDSATWSVEEYFWNSFPGTNGCIARHYGLVGDTIINNLTYSKMYGNNLPANFPYFDTTFNLNTAVYVASIREDSTKKVYVRTPGDTIDQLYYDFALNVGDTFCFNYFGTGCYPVVLVDSILIDGNFRRSIQFSPLNTETWIEGIGSTTGWFQWQYTGSWSWQLLCYTENQNQLYGTSYCHCDTYTGLNEVNASETGIAEIYPNPFLNSATIELYVDPSNSFLIITDSYGKEISRQKLNSKNTLISRSGLTSGIYFYHILKNNNIIKTGKFIIE